jgi:8-oxo-dGTP diphosphatase
MIDANVREMGVPRVPASAGALLFDQRRRLLVVKPTYKRHWTIPGGQIEADGETPWQACRRETCDAAALLSGPVRRRVLACARSDRCVYLEDGRPIGAVTG